MDYEDIRNQTKSAFEEAGVTDADLTYLTDEYIDEVVATAHDLADSGIGDGEEIALAVNEYWKPVFVGSKVYADPWFSNGSCVRPDWTISFTWVTRTLRRRCPNGNWYIWYIW